MKYNIIQITKIVILLLATITTTISCNNPLEDKETGEDITLLLIDPNVFDTKITIHLMDTMNHYLEGVEFTVYITGDGADQIVGVDGEYKTEFTTSNGIFEVAVDPAFALSASNPLALNIYAETSDFSWFGYPKQVKFVQEGSANVVLQFIELNSQKSSLVGAGGEPFTIKVDEQLITDAGWNFTSYKLFTSGIQHYGIYRPNNNQGNVVTSSLLELAPFKVDQFGTNAIVHWQMGDHSLKESLSLNFGGSKDIVSGYKPADLIECTEGLNLELVHPGNIPSTSGFVYYLIAFTDDGYYDIIYNVVSVDKFPSTINTGSFVYPPDTKEFRFVMETLNTYTLTNGDVVFPVDEICGKTIKITAKPNDDLKLYKIVVTIDKTENGSATKLAPSMNGFFREAATSDSYERFSLEEGVALVYLEENKTYHMMTYYGEDFYSFNFPTDPSKKQSVIDNAYENFEDLDNMTIEYSNETLDGVSVTVIKIDATYSGTLDF